MSDKKRDGKARSPSDAIDPKVFGEVRILPSSAWAGAYKVAGAVAAVGLAACAYGWSSDPQRFAFSYLFAFCATLCIALGALFFVMVQHLTASNWSVTVRRSSEVIMGGLPIFILLVAPVLATVHRLYPWDGANRSVEAVQSGAFANGTDEPDREPAALALVNRGITPALNAAAAKETEEILEGRKPLMNRGFFTLRSLLYVTIWGFLGWRFLSWSTRQDKERTPASTKSSQRFAPLAMAAFALTVVFASIDWLMSLDGTWYSTIFGVYVFAASALAGTASLIVLLFLLQRSGFLHGAVTIEHYHDLGKLLFGWLSFWSYIAFAQFFLIWYASVPEEVSFFHLRWTDNGETWKPVSTALFFLHFVVPFCILLSRNVKRNPTVLMFMAVFILAIHFLDIYWLVLPNLGVLAVHWLDLAAVVGVGGSFTAVVLWNLQARSLVCAGDPRLDRAPASESP